MKQAKLGIEYALKSGALGVLLLASILFGAPPASATTISYSNITNNSPNIAAQLRTEVTAVGTTAVAFQFLNDVGISSNISEIYFDGAAAYFSATPFAITTSGANVKFVAGANPPDLPGGNSITPKFEVDAGFLTQAKNPSPHNGVNASGEWVTITLNLLSPGPTGITTVLAALASGALRLGLHVTAIAGGTSDSYVSGRVTLVPLPGGVILLMTGLLGLGTLARLRARQARNTNVA